MVTTLGFHKSLPSSHAFFKFTPYPEASGKTSKQPKKRKYDDVITLSHCNRDSASFAPLPLPSSEPHAAFKCSKRIPQKKTDFQDIPPKLLQWIVSFLPRKERVITRRINKAFSQIRQDPCDQDLLDRITALRQKKPKGWQEKAVKLIRQNRQEQADFELTRLQFFKSFPDTRAQKLTQAFLEIDEIEELEAREYPHVFGASILMAQAFEIKGIYEKTHDVFIHAQMTEWMIFPTLVKELIKKFDPQKDVHNFKFLRLPLIFNSDAEPPSKGVRAFITSQVKMSDSDAQVAERLLSVDAYYYNTRQAESSIDFLLGNYNIKSSDLRIRAPALEAIKCFCPKISPKKEEEFQQQLSEIIEELSQLKHCGNLFVFCLPLKISSQIQYRAHPFGVPCDCHPQNKARSILTLLNREMFGRAVSCADGVVPQYRLYTPLLTPENGVRSYMLTPMPDADRVALKSKIKKIVNEVYDLHQLQQRRRSARKRSL